MSNKRESDMTATEIIYRPCRKEDAPEAARLVVSAWPSEEFLKMAPGMTLEYLEELVAGFIAVEKNMYSYTNTIVAEYRGSVVGAMIGYDGKDIKELKKPIAEVIYQEFGDCEFLHEDETGPGEFYLDSIGVSADMRSHGIGSGLFKAMLERAANQGYKVAGLIVDDTNPKAEALYTRLGFKTVDITSFMGHRMSHMQIEL